MPGRGQVPAGLAALVLDGAAEGTTLWAGRTDGVLQLWRWPAAMTPVAITDAAAEEALAAEMAASDEQGGGRGGASKSPPPPFVSIIDQLSPVGGLARPPSLAAATAALAAKSPAPAAKAAPAPAPPSPAPPAPAPAPAAAPAADKSTFTVTFKTPDGDLTMECPPDQFLLDQCDELDNADDFAEDRKSVV